MNLEHADDFIEIPAEIGERHEPVIKRKGVPVRAIVPYITKRHLSPVEVSRLWDGYITENEVNAAMIYWQAHSEEFDEKNV